MPDLDIEHMIGKVGSLYKLVILTALRAVELSEGAANLVGERPEAKTINTALKEIGAGKIAYKIKEKK